jgi:hypothetical protein
MWSPACVHNARPYIRFKNQTWGAEEFSGHLERLFLLGGTGHSL